MTAYVPNLRATLSVWRRDFRVFAKIWRGALLPQFLDPLFYLVAMGFGLGTYLARVEGIPYEQFIAPGLVASAVMWAASFESTWNAFFKMEETRLYDAILSTPVDVQDVIAGEVAWCASRALVYGSSFLVVVTAFGLVDSAWAVTIPLFLVLGGACFGMLGLAFTSLIPRIEFNSYYFTLFITPLFLFSGIFYPLDDLPGWASVVAWFTPLYHLVEITRSLILDPDLTRVLGNALWLLVVTLAVFVVPVRYMRRRLIA
jgi:lipooligosaccharide transport system permease protein